MTVWGNTSTPSWSWYSVNPRRWPSSRSSSREGGGSSIASRAIATRPLGDGGVPLGDAFEPPLRRVVDHVGDVRVVVSAHDLAVAHLHHRHNGEQDPFAGVELPFLHVLEDHEIAFGHDVAGMVVIAGERLDVDLEAVDDLLRTVRALP